MDDKAARRIPFKFFLHFPHASLDPDWADQNNDGVDCGIHLLMY
jgi:hypothetical protein